MRYLIESRKDGEVVGYVYSPFAPGMNVSRGVASLYLFEANALADAKKMGDTLEAKALGMTYHVVQD